MVIVDLKDDGKRYIGRGDDMKAREAYGQALDQLKRLAHSEFSDDLSAQIAELLHQLPANLALCYAHRELWEEAVRSMQQALKLAPDNLKYKTRADAIAEKMQAAVLAQDDAAQLPGGGEAKQSGGGGEAKPLLLPVRESKGGALRVARPSRVLTCASRRRPRELSMPVPNIAGETASESTVKGAQYAGARYCGRDCQREHCKEHRREVHPKLKAGC